jgi:hypothetical protein
MQSRAYLNEGSSMSFVHPAMPKRQQIQQTQQIQCLGLFFVRSLS